MIMSELQKVLKNYFSPGTYRPGELSMVFEASKHLSKDQFEKIVKNIVRSERRPSVASFEAKVRSYQKPEQQRKRTYDFDNCGHCAGTGFAFVDWEIENLVSLCHCPRGLHESYFKAHDGMARIGHGNDLRSKILPFPKHKFKPDGKYMTPGKLMSSNVVAWWKQTKKISQEYWKQQGGE